MILIEEKICYIFGAGAFSPDKNFSMTDGDYLIAADGGYDYIKQIGLNPDLIIGDFDSIASTEFKTVPCFKGTVSSRLSGDLTEKYNAINEDTKALYTGFDSGKSCKTDDSRGIRLVRYPPEKDSTDMELAINEGIEQGYNKFVIYGGTGGRFDHTFSNIQIINNLSINGKSAFLIDNEMVITTITDSKIAIDAQKGGYISIFALSDMCEGVSITGFKYELINANVGNSTVFGSCNEFIGKPGEISVKKGSLLIQWYRE